MINNLFKLFCLIGYSVSIIYIFSFLYTSGNNLAFAKDTTPNSSSAIFPYLEDAAKKINEFTLDNGMKFIVMENHSAPVVSFVTYADVGGVDEPDNKTGVAHFLEHLAFKGTTEIGTTNYAEEKEILDNLDNVFNLIKEAKNKKDNNKVQLLTKEFYTLQAKAHNYVKQNEFGRIVETAGAVNINAATSPDSTIYFYSFPSNKLELWMSLESQRFLNPVFREFYKEKNIILEERRLRTENNPIGKMVEAFLDTAFVQHPYKRPVIGYSKDINGLTRKDVQDFFDIYYGPNNLTISIVGDVKFEEVKNLAQIYFGRYPSKVEPPKISTVEPGQPEKREITLNLDSQPWYLEGYHVPSLNHPDNAVYQVIANILSSGRTARLYKSLVEDKKVALVAQGLSGYPSDKYPNLMLFYAQTSPQASVEEVAEALSLEIKKLKTELVSEQELERTKNKLRASLLRSLDSNLGMARALAEYEVKTGQWNNLFSQVQDLEAVSAEDIKRIANVTFKEENMTIGRILPKKK